MTPEEQDLLRTASQKALEDLQRLRQARPEPLEAGTVLQGIRRIPIRVAFAAQPIVARKTGRDILGQPISAGDSIQRASIDAIEICWQCDWLHDDPRLFLAYRPGLAGWVRDLAAFRPFLKGQCDFIALEALLGEGRRMLDASSSHQPTA